jgi:hypothetical protein
VPSIGTPAGLGDGIPLLDIQSWDEACRRSSRPKSPSMNRRSAESARCGPVSPRSFAMTGSIAGQPSPSNMRRGANPRRSIGTLCQVGGRWRGKEAPAPHCGTAVAVAPVPRGRLGPATHPYVGGLSPGMDRRHPPDQGYAMRATTERAMPQSPGVAFRRRSSA